MESTGTTTTAELAVAPAWEWAPPLLDPHEYAATCAKIEKINARAVKRGFTGRLGITGEPVEVEREVVPGLKVTETWYKVTITGEPPRYNGWTFLAALDWDEHAGLIVSTAPGVDKVDRTGLREGWCDYCRRTRRRTRTYLVAHEDGRRHQVGSTCIKDFLGWQGGLVFLPVQQAQDEVDGLAVSHGAGRAGEWDTEDVLAIAWACIQAFGFRPASSYGWSTKGMVLDVLQPPKTAADREEWDKLKPHIEKARPMARTIRRWVLDELAGDSEYVRNLRAYAAPDKCTDRSIGLLVSAPQAWAKAQERDLVRRREHEQLNNTHRGEVGERIEVTIQVKAVRYIDGYMPNTSTAVYTLAGDDARVYKWFSSNHALDEDAADGTRYRLRGTVKKHTEWRDTKETHLTRCKVLEELPPAEEPAA